MGLHVSREVKGEAKRRTCIIGGARNLIGASLHYWGQARSEDSVGVNC